MNLLMKFLNRKRNPLALYSSHFPRSRNKCIVHVGAHLAEEREKYEALGFERILWIEGSPSTFERLKNQVDGFNEDNAQRYSNARHYAVCGLMADTDGDPVLLRAFSNDGLSSSLFAATETMKKRWPELYETGARESVPTARLDTLLSRMPEFQEIDLLVVDVQGAELMVMKGAHETLRKTKALICEVSAVAMYEGGVLFPELAKYVADFGFEPQSVPRRHGDMFFRKNAR